MVKTQVPYSSFLRGPAAVVAALDDGDVVLERRGTESLVLTMEHRFHARQQGLSVAARALRRLAARDPKEAAALLEEEMPWLRWLPGQELQACLEELLADLEAGADTDNLEPFARSVQAWQSTAEVWADPNLARRLRRSFPGDGEEISRPASS